MKSKKKAKQKINYKLNQKSILLIIVIVLVLVIAFGSWIYLKNKRINNKETDNDIEILATELLGEKRLEEQQKIYDIIDKYIKNNPQINNYLEKNNIKSLSIKDLKDKLNIDISEFEKTNHKCDTENTMIDFTEGYQKYTISLSCDAFLLSK